MFVGVRNRWLPLLAVTLAALTGNADADTLVVNSVGDTPDALPGNGACGATGIPASCTLRAAIQEANANADASNTIDLTGLSGTITVTTALPDITKAVAINGPSARVTVDGSDIASLFRLICTTAPCPSGGAYSISNLVVTNGRTTDTSGGGGIYFGAAGTVNFTLSNVELSNNEATAGPGGGIAAVLVSNNSTLTFSNVQIGTSGNGNTSSGDGGGLWVRFDGTTATMTLEDASVVGNTTSAGNGGGVAVARGRLNVYESSLSGNTANVKGGGLYLARTGSAGGSARLENVTISGNTAASGGGIGAAAANPASSSMTFTTVAGNTAASGGGGIDVATDPGTTFPGNSANFPFTSNIVAGNGGAECAAAFSHGDADNSGYNLTDEAESGSSCGFAAAANDRFASTAAELGLAALASNPSQPQTRALLAGSLAIDAGNPAWDTGNDARGASSQDGGADGTPGDGTPVRDIGAYEFGGFGLVQLSLPGYEVGEDQGPALVLIKRYGTGTAIATTPTVVLSSADATATAGNCGSAGSDYTALASNPMNFVFTASGAMQFEHTASFAICNDLASESSESFGVSLAEPGNDSAGYDLGPISSGTVTILDVENGAFRFNPLAYSQNEGNAGSGGSVTLTVTRVSGSMGAVRVSYDTNGTCSPACTATADTDYTSAGGFVDFADGETSKTVTVDFVGDTAYEGHETFAVRLTAVSCQGLAPGQGCDARFVGTPERTATVTINNDDSPVTGQLQFELAGYTANEEAGTLTVKVKRVGGSDGAVSVDVAAQNGTASQGSDFNVTSPVGGTLNWGVGDAADKIVTVSLVDDVLTESHENFTLELSNAQTSTGGLPPPTLGEIPVAAVTLVSDEQPAFEFSAGSYGVNEGGSVTLTVTWTAFTGGNVTVPYFTQDGTALSPVDYTGIPQATPGTITAVAGGSTSATFQVAVATDALTEGNETFAATLGTPTGGGDLGASTPATVTIVDPAGVRFTAASFTRANELSGGTITAAVERLGDLSEPFTVDFEIGECAGAGCATQGDDFYRLAGTTGTLSWSAGDGAAQPVTINVQSDTLIEGDETVLLALSNPQVGAGPTTNPGALGLAQAVAVIPDDDYRFEIAHASPFAVSEGAGSAVISVNRVGSTLGAASVSFATADGTALAGSDYTATASPPALSWNAGEGGAKTVTVPLTGDALDEFDETFTLALGNPSANVIGEATTVAGSPLMVSITDDDAPAGVALSLSGSPLAENGGVATVTATLSAVSAKDVTVNLAFGGGGGAAGADYAAAAASIEIPAGSLQGSIAVTGLDDALDEDDEIVTVDIDSVVNGTETGTQQVVAAIVDDDATPTVTLALAGSPLPENGGVASVTATLSAVSGRSVTVNLEYGGTATAGADYAASSASIVIAAGQQSASATLTAANDALDEDSETVVADIASVVNGDEPGTQQVTATIIDDDATPTVTLALAGSPFAENGGVATVTATLSAVSGRSVTVNLAFSGTATAGTDYAASAASIVIAAGQNSGSATLTGANDPLDEAAETVIVDIGSVTNAAESGTQQLTATIADDDAGPSVTLSSSVSSMAETGGTATITATLSAVSGQDVTVTLGFAGTAASPADYTASATSIIIAAGATAGSITLASVDDGANEPDETVVVDVTAVTNGTESGAQTQTVSITDDDSGGGGGALDLLTLGLLLAGLARRRRGAPRPRH